MMAAATESTSLVSIQPLFTDAERLALAGYLAGYRGLTREAYTLDLRQFTGWCRARSVPLFSVRRADIETFARDLEARGRARGDLSPGTRSPWSGLRHGHPPPVHDRGVLQAAVEEELLDHSPAAHVRRPRLDESHATALDRNEVGALLVAAGLGPATEHALISLLALNGLRVSRRWERTSSTWVWNAGTGPSSSPARAARSSRSRSPRAPPAPSTWPSASAPAVRFSWQRTRDGNWIITAPRGSSAVPTRRAGISKVVSLLAHAAAESGAARRARGSLARRPACTTPALRPGAHQPRPPRHRRHLHRRSRPVVRGDDRYDLTAWSAVRP